jgi:hypothetical protein
MCYLQIRASGYYSTKPCAGQGHSTAELGSQTAWSTSDSSAHNSGIQGLSLKQSMRMERVRAACIVRAAKQLAIWAKNQAFKKARGNPESGPGAKEVTAPTLPVLSPLAMTHPIDRSDRPLVCRQCKLVLTADPAHGMDGCRVHIYIQLARVEKKRCFQSFPIHSFRHCVCLITDILDWDS